MCVVREGSGISWYSIKYGNTRLILVYVCVGLFLSPPLMCLVCMCVSQSLLHNKNQYVYNEKNIYKNFLGSNWWKPYLMLHTVTLEKTSTSATILIYNSSALWEAQEWKHSFFLTLSTISRKHIEQNYFTWLLSFCSAKYKRSVWAVHITYRVVIMKENITYSVRKPLLFVLTTTSTSRIPICINRNKSHHVNYDTLEDGQFNKSQLRQLREATSITSWKQVHYYFFGYLYQHQE